MSEFQPSPADAAAGEEPTPETKSAQLMFQNAYTNQFQFSAEDRERMQKLLRQKLPFTMISTRQGPGGQKLAYLEGHRVIDLANDVFSPFNWSSSVSDLSCDYTDKSGGYFCVGVTALVRVTLRDGTYHEDVGFGDARLRSRGDAIKKAKKQAVTDGLKRCLRLFGNGLGNCLLDKEYMARAKKGRFEEEDFADEQYTNPSLNRLMTDGKQKLQNKGAAPRRAPAGRPMISSNSMPARPHANSRPPMRPPARPPATNSTARTVPPRPAQPHFSHIATAPKLGDKRAPPQAAQNVPPAKRSKNAFEPISKVYPALTGETAQVEPKKETNSGFAFEDDE